MCIRGHNQGLQQAPKSDTPFPSLLITWTRPYHCLLPLLARLWQPDFHESVWVRADRYALVLITRGDLILSDSRLRVSGPLFQLELGRAEYQAFLVVRISYSYQRPCLQNLASTTSFRLRCSWNHYQKLAWSSMVKKLQGTVQKQIWWITTYHLRFSSILSVRPLMWIYLYWWLYQSSYTAVLIARKSIETPVASKFTSLGCSTWIYTR